jgi:hypothetical protein
MSSTLVGAQTLWNFGLMGLCFWMLDWFWPFHGSAGAGWQGDIAQRRDTGGGSHGPGYIIFVSLCVFSWPINFSAWRSDPFP